MPPDILSYTETKKLTSGRSLTMPGFGQSTYFDNGSYTFKYEGQTVSQFGSFRIQKDGKVCVSFQNSNTRCDAFVKDRGVLFLLTEEGNRFPVFLGLEVK